MYLDHFGLCEAPFRITPQTEYFFSGAQRGPMLDALLFAITHDEGIIKVTGEVGVGKTMLCRMTVERLPVETQSIYLTNPSLTPQELLQTLAHELTANVKDSPTVLRAIEERLIELYAQGRRVVVIIDEAHAMPKESLECVRLLSNLESGSRKLLQLVLFGQPELDNLLSMQEMRSLRERITQSFELGPLNKADVGDYLRFRLRAAGYRGSDLFSPTIQKRIAQASGGLTRRINIIADKTLLCAFADNTCNINTRHVDRAIKDAGYDTAASNNHHHSMQIWWWVGALASALLVGGFIWWGTQNAKAHPQAVQQHTPASSNASVSAPVAAIAETQNTPTVEELAKPVTQDTSPTDSEHPSSVSSMLLGPIAQARIASAQVLQEKAHEKRWFIQLQTILSPNAHMLEEHVKQLENILDPAQLKLYENNTGNSHRFDVIYGDYSKETEARQALSQLPDRIKQHGAYVRAYNLLKFNSN